MSYRSLLAGAVGTFALIANMAVWSPTVPAVDRPAVATEHYYPEVRLRKLHLVRPDLIPYPVTFDIYC